MDGAREAAPRLEPRAIPERARSTGSQASQASVPFAVAAPKIELPKGGGAIRGVGEKFAANPVTGTGSMSVPIATSSGRSGFGPQLALSYDSGAGNGPFGFGWSLSLPSITRKTDKGLPRYRDAEDSDVFILSGAEDLVPVYRQDFDGTWIAKQRQGFSCDEDGCWVRDPRGRLAVHEDEVGGFRVRRYRPRIEGLFARIERWSRIGAVNDVHWRSISKDNILTLYGWDVGSRIADASDGRIFSWLICETRDDKGNGVLYRYKAEDSVGIELQKTHERNRTDAARGSNRYLKRILYGNRDPLLNVEGQRLPSLDNTTIDEQIDKAAWMFELVFDYGDHDPKNPSPGDDEAEASAKTLKYPWPPRADAFSSYRAGFEVRTARVCRRALMFHHFPGSGEVGRDCLVRSTDFTYSDDVVPTDACNPIYTFLKAVAQTGYLRRNGGYTHRSLPPVEFDYSPAEVQDTVETVEPESLENLPVGLDGTVYRWTDLHGEGVAGILTEQAGAWFYKRNLSPIPEKLPGGREQKKARFAALETVGAKPNVSLSSGAEFMDLAGDGQPDLVIMTGATPGLYEHDDAEGWQSFRAFTSRLTRDLRDPNVKFIDLDGDGHADVLISEDDAFVWHASLAEEGFGPARRIAQALDEERGPRIVFADGTQSVYLADLSGDGLTDIVRIRNGDVCYWPNLGHGRFGAKIAMGNAPLFDNPDQFDHKRLRLVDIDGSGTTDIIYLHRDVVRLYFNQSGNSWSQPQELTTFPRIDDIASILPMDLLGNGTACLVWSSSLQGDTPRHMRYVNLMGECKPHLLVGVINNLGAETRVEYAPSTKFYLQDKRDGRPWITRLPFPVHVVERVFMYDHISRNRFDTRYEYHHGYFDGEEREFRGFGTVEQWDSEVLPALAREDAFPLGDNNAAESHVTPVRTITWFHTGVYLGRDRVSNLFAGLPTDQGKYFREPGLTDDEARSLLLPYTVFPPGLTLQEEREACRALKGSMLRQEVYADDAGPEATPEEIERARTPYAVTEQNFSIRAIQPAGSNRHAVFFTRAREAIHFHYEREPADPRTTHTMALEVDDYGNVLKQAEIAYGRRTSDAVLPTDEDRAKQRLTHITYAENAFTDAIAEEEDCYRTPMPAESRTYELRKPEQEKSKDGLPKLFGFEDLLQHIGQAGDGEHDVDYEDLAFARAREAAANNPAVGEKYFRRLIEHARTQYRPDDMGMSQNDPMALLPLRTVGRMALPGESYKLAFTPGLLEHVFVRLRPAEVPDVLGGQGPDQGGYVDLDGDGRWWIPSGRVFHSPHSGDGAVEELAYARQHFFLPLRYRDPFAQTTTVAFDADDLLVLEARDPLDNRITAGERTSTGDIDPYQRGNDYRVLQARLVTDPNGNRSAVAFDALGLVAGTAVMGKRSPAPLEGDSLAGFETDLGSTQIHDFHDAEEPHALAPSLLGDATTRVVYDLDRFQRTRRANPEHPAQWLPVSAVTLAREAHISDPLSPQGLKIQISFSYSDGFGREIQKKIQAEPERLNGDVGPARWVGSGWTIFNNKGKPVRQYEPFFSALPPGRRHHFEFGVEVGVSSVIFYDPIERVVATLHPNHTYEKVVFDPWQQATWDVNDTVLDDPRTDRDVRGHVAKYFGEQSNLWQTWYQERMAGSDRHEKSAATRAARHASTPTVAHFDSLGRPFLTLAHNRFERSGTLIDEKYPTRIALDIEGNHREVVDALGRIVMRYDYAIAGPMTGQDEVATNRVHQASMDAGERWTTNDVAGRPIRAWDSRGFVRRMTYDELRRITGLHVTEKGVERLAEQTVYGESQGDANNLRARVYKVFDGAGVVIHHAYDFKGNLLTSQRDLLPDYEQAVDWRNQDLKANDGSFSTGTRYDALNRPLEVTSPDASIYRPAFNEANLLDKVDVNMRGEQENGEPQWTTFVANIDYNAKGQRERIVYGNGARTQYEYDPLTFRLTRLTTTRPSGPNDFASQLFASATLVQDLRYTYDPARNITRIEDAALNTVFHDGQQVEPVCEYTYDSTFRLIEAKGREHTGQCGFQFSPGTNCRDYPYAGAAHPNDLHALSNYTERYEYDEVGNLQFMRHAAGDGSWSRKYAYDADSLLEPGTRSNRVTKSAVAGYTEIYTYTDGDGADVHGCMTAINSEKMIWEFEDQLQQMALGGGGTAFYVYGASGQRVRKVIQTQNGARLKERIYVGGFEVYREYNGNGESVRLERETLHVMADQQRIALTETQTIKDGQDVAKRIPLHRYQIGNHLGSASVELDAVAALISYEDYHPYGTTALQASAAEVSPKRYRYTGKERDGESGFCYHGARYYAPWLGRWVSADPSGIKDHVNLYAFVGNDPLGWTDPDGNQRRKWMPYLVEWGKASFQASKNQPGSPMWFAGAHERGIAELKRGAATATAAASALRGGDIAGAAIAVGRHHLETLKHYAPVVGTVESGKAAIAALRKDDPRAAAHAFNALHGLASDVGAVIGLRSALGKGGGGGRTSNRTVQGVPEYITPEKAQGIRLAADPLGRTDPAIPVRPKEGVPEYITPEKAQGIRLPVDPHGRTDPAIPVRPKEGVPGYITPEKTQRTRLPPDPFRKTHPAVVVRIGNRAYGVPR